MSTGGATWDTAGNLTLGAGSGNTFAIADATEPGSAAPFNHAWWVYTAPSDGFLILDTFATTGTNDALVDTVMRVYSDPTEPPDLDDFAFENDDSLDSPNTILSKVTFPVTAGSVWHILVGSFSDHGSFITTYRVAAALDADEPDDGTVTSPWFSDLRDSTENWVILSSGDLAELNLTHSFPESPDWFDDVVLPAPGRAGAYGISEVLGGSWDVPAMLCAINHARNGDNDSQLWNGTTTDIDDTSDPICRTIFPGVSNTDNSPTSPSHSSTFQESAPPVTARTTSAHVAASARGIWILPFRDNLDERGVLPFPDPETRGYPTDAVLEWEGDLELAKVELTIDDFGTAPVAADDYLAVDINQTLRPAYIAGDWDEFWLTGFPPGIPPPVPEVMADELTPKPRFTIDEDPTRPWVEYEGLDDWAKCFDPATEEPDIVATMWTAAGRYGWTGEIAGSNGNLFALKVTVRSPRYRWVYEPPGFIPPRRIGQRSDGLTHGARRLGSGNTRQSGSRTLGAIL